MNRRRFIKIAAMAGAVLGLSPRTADVPQSVDAPKFTPFTVNDKSTTWSAIARDTQFGGIRFIEDPTCPHDTIYAFDTKSLPPEVYKLITEQQERDIAHI